MLQRTGRAEFAHEASEVAIVLRRWIEEYRATGSAPVPDDWREKARSVSGISRGLGGLEHMLLGDTPGRAGPR